MTSADESADQEGPVIRDRRRIDPETGEVRRAEPAAGPAQDDAAEPADAATEGDGEVSKFKAQLDERTADLQRLQAEYANYRKRVDRDRAAVREQAVGNVLMELLPILDDLGRARDHDELTGGFKSVAEALENATGKLGLQRYGEKGEPFDPIVHEALMHSYSTDVTEPTCIDILQPGYRIGERILRPARVAVAEPQDAPAQPAADAGADAPSATGADSAGDAADTADHGDDSGDEAK